MKTKNFLTLLIAATMLFGLASCGSDNEKKGAPAPVPVVQNNNPVNTEYSDTVRNGIGSVCEFSSSFDDFRNKVNQGRFITDYYAQNTFEFAKAVPELDEGEFLGFIPYSTLRWRKTEEFTRTSVRNELSATHEWGNDKITIRNNLVNILNQTQQQRGSGSYYEVLTGSGEIYGISLCLPIAANPVYRANRQTGEVYFIEGVNTSGGNMQFNFGFSY